MGDPFRILSFPVNLRFLRYKIINLKVLNINLTSASSHNNNKGSEMLSIEVAI
jgi:hypothetical protein